MKLNFSFQSWSALFAQSVLGRKIAESVLSKHERQHHEHCTGSMKAMAAWLLLWKEIEAAWNNFHEAALLGRPLYPLQKAA